MKKNLLPSILSIFRSQIGTTEIPAGSNQTKYGEAYGWNGQPWCVMFLWWGFKEANQSRLFFDGNKTASCSELMYWAIEKGLWVTSGYQAGDLVIMDFPNNKTTTDHIGIVEKAENNFLYTIEGNTSSSDEGSQSNGDGVWAKVRDTSKTIIVGAVRPNYIEEIVEESQTSSSPSSKPVSLTEFKLLWARMRAGLQGTDANSWSKEAREWALSNKIVDVNKAWKDVVTKEQLIEVLYRFSKLLESSNEEQKTKTKSVFGLFKTTNK